MHQTTQDGGPRRSSWLCASHKNNAKCPQDAVPTKIVGGSNAPLVKWCQKWNGNLMSPEVVLSFSHTLSDAFIKELKPPQYSTHFFALWSAGIHLFFVVHCWWWIQKFFKRGSLHCCGVRQTNAETALSVNASLSPLGWNICKNRLNQNKLLNGIHKLNFLDTKMLNMFLHESN